MHAEDLQGSHICIRYQHKNLRCFTAPEALRNFSFFKTATDKNLAPRTVPHVVQLLCRWWGSIKKERQGREASPLNVIVGILNEVPITKVLHKLWQDVAAVERVCPCLAILWDDALTLRCRGLPLAPAL